MNALDYELHFEDGEWEVWTPAANARNCGACIGSGATKTTALLYSIYNMAATTRKMANEVAAIQAEQRKDLNPK